MNRKTFFIVEAVLQCSNAGKQVLGQRMASFLGLEPGPRGSDDGIDGFIVFNGKKIHFQSKLKSTLLDRDDARSYFSDIDYHKAAVSVMLAAKGYKDTFRERLFGHDGIRGVSIHLLTLEDVVEKTPAFERACDDMPSLRPLDDVIKRTIG